MFFVLPCIHDLLARQIFVEKVGFMENVSRDEFKRCRVFWSVQFSQPLNSGQAVGQGKQPLYIIYHALHSICLCVDCNTVHNSCAYTQDFMGKFVNKNRKDEVEKALHRRYNSRKKCRVFRHQSFLKADTKHYITLDQLSLNMALISVTL